MKSLSTKSTAIFLATAMLFASCGETHEVFDVTNDEMETTKDHESALSLTIQKLDDINRVLPAPVNDENSRNWFSDGRNLLSNAVDGAFDGAVAGYKAGRSIGRNITDIGSINGGISGGITGGLIGSIAGSTFAYVEKDGEEFSLSPEDVMDGCAMLEKAPGVEFVFDEIVVPDSIERIGYIHNLAMDALVNSKELAVEIHSNKPMLLDSDNLEKVDPIITFTQFDKDVIASTTYVNAYNQILSQQRGEVVQKSISGQVIERYISALKNYASPVDYRTVVSITNQYIAVVNDSAELSDEDKTQLYIAFSVGVYSYKYWSNFDFGATSAEE